MSILEIVSGGLLILSCVLIIIIVSMQESASGMSQSFGGSEMDSFYGKNKARTVNGMMLRVTKIAAVILFVMTIAVNFFNIFSK